MMLHKKRRARSPALWLSKGEVPRETETSHRGRSAVTPPEGDDGYAAWEALFRDGPEECVPWNGSDVNVDDEEEY